MNGKSLMEEAVKRWMPASTDIKDILADNPHKTMRRVRYQIRRKDIQLQALKTIIKTVQEELNVLHEIKRELELRETPIRVIFSKRKEKKSLSGIFNNASEATIEKMLASGELERLIKDAVTSGQLTL